MTAGKIGWPLALGLLLVLPALAYNSGDAVQAFSGTDADGGKRSLADYQGKVLVVVVWGSQCPTSKKYGKTLAALQKSSGAQFLGVAPNAGETPTGVKAASAAAGIKFPTVVTGGGAVAKSFGANATPTVYVIDATGKLRYQGAIADKPGRSTKQHYLRDALQAVTSGKAPAKDKTSVRGFRITY